MNADGSLNVPDHPVIPFIEGDGTGPDIWRASVRVLDAAVEKEFSGKKKIAWTEVYAGERPRPFSIAGCPMRRWKRSRLIWSASRVR